MTQDVTIPLQHKLIESLWREIRMARDKATKARQEAAFAEDRLNLLIRQMIHAGIAPDDDERFTVEVDQ